MVRLRRKASSEDELPVDHDLARNGMQPRPAPQMASRTSPRKKIPTSYRDNDGDSEAEYGEPGDVMQPRMTPKRNGNSKQIRLAPLSLQPSLRTKAAPSVRLDSPRKPQAKPMHKSFEKALHSAVGESSDSVPEVDAEESIWCGSGASSEDSEDELPSPRKFLVPARTPINDLQLDASVSFLTANGDIRKSSQSWLRNGAFDGTKSKESTSVLRNAIDSESRPASSSDKENQSAFLRFSPPRIHKSGLDLSLTRPVTPPQSPTKSRLQSPTKTKTRIPTPPHRQSLDAFWDADTVNGWNEQHSPRKILKSPRKLKFLQDDSQQSPTSSPRKSPFKRTKAALEARRTFETAKHRIAEDFLAELDARITDGQIGNLAASTGGVHFVWSKTLNSTAGRANWRRETTKTKHADGTSSIKHKHHASIELAEKVIDDEDRLLNVIAHEFCHLANFMVSGIKDQPHGRQFKEWGRKCTSAFGNRGVKVTTKHSFEIEYKYIWQCCNEECGVEFKRHSKSIDPKRHTCGSCRSKLVQIKPVPRKTGENGQASGYAAYVKANFAAVRKSLPGASQKEIMEAVAKKYREEKRAKDPTDSTAGSNAGGRASDELDQVANALEVITIED